MGIINILDTQTANLIAAGEVVESPGSAVKEMLENSADAHAKNITVEIKDGGVSFIRITDDGDGMAAEDVPKTILRHATSKIKNSDDLNAIYTLGFRGEALAAIASVSRMRILTKRKEDEFGTFFQCAFGTQISIEEAGCPNGTTIIVENLFENTPARKNFLRRNLTEASHVMMICERFALSRPKISVTLIGENTVKLRTPGDGQLKNLLYACIGKEFVSSLLRINYTQEGVRVCGYIGTPENCRANRNLQNFFVNGRWIRCRTLTNALEDGFHGFCPTGKFPTCALYIVIDPRLIDVNSHPAKLEVKFAHDQMIFTAVYFAVRGALGAGIGPRGYTTTPDDAFSEFPTDHRMTVSDVVTDRRIQPSFVSSVPVVSPPSEPDGDEQPSENCGIPFDRPNVPILSDARAPQTIPQDSSPAAPTHENDISSAPADIPESGGTTAEPPPDGCTRNDSGADLITRLPAETPPENQPPSDDGTADAVSASTPSSNTASVKTNPFDTAAGMPPPSQSAFIGKDELLTPRLIGEAFDTYLLVEYGSKLYFIDKHAAHERIIYERIKHTSDNNDAQYLLDPIAVTLTANEFEAVGRYTDYFTRIGFDLELFGDDAYLVRSTPTAIPLSQIKDTVTFLAGSLAEGNPRAAGDVFDRALFTAACKAAIKGGSKDTELDDLFIVREIFHNDAVLYCPHGRPILIEYTKERLEKLFGRT